MGFLPKPFTASQLTRRNLVCHFPAIALDDFCTCPYSWGPCKHAVAVVLAAAEQVKTKQTIPLLDSDSDLGQTLFGDADEDKWIDDEQEKNREPGQSPMRTKAQAKVEKMLENRSHDELLQLLIDLSARFPEVRQYIIESGQLASGQVDKLVRALRSEIRNLTAEPAWYNHWRGEGSLPDYSHVEDKLRALADQGYADAVLQLGEDSGPRATARWNSRMTREKPPWPSALAWMWSQPRCRTPPYRPPTSCFG